MPYNTPIMDRICGIPYRVDASGRGPRWAESLEITRDATLYYGRKVSDQVRCCSCEKVCSAMAKVADFVKENRYSLFAYIIAWGVILACIGMMHGFKMTSSPFSIGMGAGIGLGGLFGVLCVKVFDSKNSLGGRISGRAQKHLDFTTRQIALTVFVAVYLIAASRLPHGIGAISGIIIGDHVATKFLLGKEIVKHATTIEEELASLKERVNELEKRSTLQSNHEEGRDPSPL